MIEWNFEPEPESQLPRARETACREHTHGDHTFDAKRDKIERFYARVAETLVAPYYLDIDRGVIVLTKGRQKSVDICAPLLISSLIRSSDGLEASLRVEVLTDDAEIEICDIPNDDLGSALPRGVSMLRARGIYMPANAREVAAFLRSFRPPVLRGAELPCGWHPSGKPVFGLRDGRAVTVINAFAQNEPQAFALFQPDVDKFSRWKSEVACLADDNPYVLFGICLALTGPILKLLKRTPVGFNLAMRTSSGKTTVAQIMEHMWPAFQIEGWLHSEAGLEDICIASRDSLLLLDEMPKGRDRNVIENVYFIMNGRPRVVRRKIEEAANITRARDWSMAVLSTSETPFEDMVRHAGGTAEGALVRLIDLKPTVIWENFHGLGSTYDLIKHLNGTLPQTSGVAGPFFVRLFSKQQERMSVKVPAAFDWSLRHLESALNIKRGSASGAQMRVLEAFAAVMTAGQIAGQMKILPQTPASIRAHILQVAAAWANPPAASAHQQQIHQDAIERLRAWLAQNAGAKLIALNARGAAESNARMACGWRTDEAYFLLKPTLQNATGLKHGTAPFLEHLATRGILIRGGQPSSYQQRMGAGVHGRPWVYAINRSALEDGSDGQ